jgi:hypothetical protein
MLFVCSPQRTSHPVDFTPELGHFESMRRSLLTAIFLSVILAGARAQDATNEFDADISASGLVPVSWAADSPTLAHLGFDALFGFEYDSPISLQFRVEGGYLRASASYVSSDGELYRGWEGLRIAFMGGYAFGPVPLRKLGRLDLSLLCGGALTAADYLDTALAYAYPSLILEPRLFLRIPGHGGSASVQGPWIAIPCELMFRAGTYSLAPGLSLGWRYRLGAIR